MKVEWINLIPGVFLMNAFLAAASLIAVLSAQAVEIRNLETVRENSTPDFTFRKGELTADGLFVDYVSSFGRFNATNLSDITEEHYATYTEDLKDIVLDSLSFLIVKNEKVIKDLRKFHAEQIQASCVVFIPDSCEYDYPEENRAYTLRIAS
jgi:hypothetical protein